MEARDRKSRYCSAKQAAHGVETDHSIAQVKWYDQMVPNTPMTVFELIAAISGAMIIWFLVPILTALFKLIGVA